MRPLPVLIAQVLTACCAVLLLLGLGGCRCPSTQYPTEQELSARFLPGPANTSSPLPSPVTSSSPGMAQDDSPTPAQPKSDVRIYIDFSPSMIGYVTIPSKKGSDPQGLEAPIASILDSCDALGETLFQKVVVNLKTSAAGGRSSPTGKTLVYSFRDKIEQIQTEDLWKSIQGGASAFEGFSLIAQAIQHAIDDSNKWDLAVFVTDGVQSDDASSGPLAIQEKLKAWAGKQGGSWEIIGIRSQFNGKVWSLSNPQPEHAFIYDSGWRDPQRFRPFYLLVLTHDAASLDRFNKTFLPAALPCDRGLGDLWQVYAPNGPVAKGVAVPSPTETGWRGIDKIGHKLKGPDGNPWLTVRHEPAPRVEPEFSFRIDIGLGDMAPLEPRPEAAGQEAQSILEFQVERLRWPRESGAVQGTAPEEDVSISLSDGPAAPSPRPVRAPSGGNESGPSPDVGLTGTESSPSATVSPTAAGEAGTTMEAAASCRTGGQEVSRQSVFQKVPRADSQTICTAYRVTLRPSRQAWRIPNWIERWATGRDNLEENASRTYRLDKLLEGFADEAFEKPLGTFFLVVQEP